MLIAYCKMYYRKLLRTFILQEQYNASREVEVCGELALHLLEDWVLSSSLRPPGQ